MSRVPARPISSLRRARATTGGSSSSAPKLGTERALVAVWLRGGAGRRGASVTPRDSSAGAAQGAPVSASATAGSVSHRSPGRTAAPAVAGSGVWRSERTSSGCALHPQKRSSMRIGCHPRHPAASRAFLGASIGGDGNTAITHRITEARAKFWSLERVFRSRVLNKKLKMQSLRTEVVRVPLRGCAVWNLRMHCGWAQPRSFAWAVSF